MKILDKTILVSGGSKGLGLVISNELLGLGYKVLAFARNKNAQTEKLKNIYPDLYFFYEFDMSNTEGIRVFVSELTKEHGYIYGLVNNAAIGVDGILPTLHDSEILSSININVTSQILLTKYVSRVMIRHKLGVILNVSSIVSLTGYNGLSVYAFAKAGQVGFTKSLARELGKLNIRVNAILPGFMETDMTSAIGDANLKKITSRSPLKCLVTPKEVSNMVSFLLDEKNTGITGQSFIIDAGSTS
jgi:3-oxoacyl-[acyl-carrier protein] reductase